MKSIETRFKNLNKTNTMKTFEQCCRDVAEKNWPDSPDKVRFFMATYATHPVTTQSAELYANEKLKGLLEEVREFEADLSKNRNKLKGDFVEYFVNGFTAHQIHIATRIEELLSSSQRQENDTANQ